MKRIQIIKKILGKQIEPYGFEYDGYTHNRWTFKRIVNNVEQEIVLVKDLYCKELRIQISTSEQGIPLEIRDITEDERYSNKFSWKYSSEEEYIQVLQELSNLVVKYCIDKFEEISVALCSYKPTEEMHYNLYVNNKKLEKDFSDLYNADTMLDEEKLLLITNLMKKNWDKNYEEIKEFLVKISAFYGKIIMKNIGGKWRWNDEFKKCIIYDMKGPFVSYDVLDKVVYTWGNKDAYNIVKGYTDMYTIYTNWVIACEMAKNK